MPRNGFRAREVGLNVQSPTITSQLSGNAALLLNLLTLNSRRPCGQHAGSGNCRGSGQWSYYKALSVSRKRCYSLLCRGTALEYAKPCRATTGHQRSFSTQAKEVIFDAPDLRVLG